MCVFCFLHVGFRPHGSLQASTRIGAQQTHKTQALFSPCVFFSFEEPSFAKTGSGRSCTIYIGKLIKGVSIFIYYFAGDITVDEVSGHPSIDLSSLEGDIELLLPSDAFRSEKRNETKRKYSLFLFLSFGVLFTLSCVLWQDKTNSRSTLPR
jgi:hypothetical protein